jgi:glycosyltransferase XagB
MNRQVLDKLSQTANKLLSASNQPVVSVVLPTFNESKNVAELLREIATAMREADLLYECVFVDDSTDNTPAVIIAEATRYPGQVTLIKRVGEDAKTGLTRAFRDGFVVARGEVIVCMDTDLQHPPAVIPRLVENISRPAVDVAVASRYTLGGSAEGLNGFFRHLVSRVTNVFVHILLPGTRATSDPMTGFFAFKKELLERVEFSSLGFKILVELLSSIEQPQVIDVPLTFRHRQDNASKATYRQGLLAYRDIIKLFATGPRGSETLRLLLLSGIISVIGVYGVSSLANLQFLMDKPLPLWMGVGFLLAISMICSSVVLSWVFSKYRYGSLTFENTVLIFTHALMVVLSGWYMMVITQSYTVYYPSLTPIFSIAFAQIAVYALLRPLWQKNYEQVRSPERWFVLMVLAIIVVTVSYFINEFVWWNYLLLLFYVAVVSQGLFALYLMIYTWEKGEHDTVEPGTVLAAPNYSFTAIVPCKHEMNTIADTIRAMHRINYPAEKKEILVVIHEGTDDGTIGVVRDTIADLGDTQVRLVTYNKDPVNKPHGLNYALTEAKGDFVTIFDAEDEPHPDLFTVINTELVRSGADVVQSGVQLMNYDSNWYSTFNVLEYYFWFKSSLHFYARQGVVPLGGVSVFFRRRFLERVGGWDMTCLTEDAEIGMRLSQAGAKMTVVYNATYATQEETPPTLVSFIKQRTRWAQGFLQILGRGTYRYFPTYRQRLLALYVLSWPIIIPVVFLLLPFGITMMLLVSLEPMLAVIANVSLLLFSAFVVVQVLGFYEFTREYKIRFPWWRIPLIVFLFYPYTVLLAVASIRAMYRQVAQINVWEKTEHRNVHRQTATVPDQKRLAPIPVTIE